MRLINREEYKHVSISEFELSARALHCLTRAGYTNLYLVIENFDKLPLIPSMGEKSLREIDLIVSEIMRKNEPTEEPSDALEENPTVAVLPESIACMPVTRIHASTRILNSLLHEKVLTIGEAYSLSISDMQQFYGFGSASARQLREQLDLIAQQGEAYFPAPAPRDAAQSAAEKDNRRLLDTKTARILLKEYGLKTAQLCEWYGVSKQRMQQKLSHRVYHGCWCGRELTDDERSAIESMAATRSFFYENGNARFYLFNNKQDNCAFLIVTDEEIKCFFLQDLPENMRTIIIQQRLDKLTEAECSSNDTHGSIVYILKEPYFLPDDPAAFRKLAIARGLPLDDYSRFLHGMPLYSRNVTITDERITAFLEEHTANGITSIPATSDTQWLRSYISRSPYSTDEFIAFYGFSPAGSSTSNPFGDIDNPDDVEPDMRIFEKANDPTANIYATSPLIGSCLLSQDVLTSVNQNSRENIIRILKNPSEELDLRAKMEITLAVINYAKNWDAEDESKFWRFITAQFGFHDETGKLRSILCSCVRDSLVSNNRLFVVISSGNQFKSSIMVHALSTKRSWMYFCDLLFEFYKTNLNWEYIEGDPMIGRMVLTLRNRMLAADADDEDIEINSNLYKFREGLIKLITLRPKYAEKLAETMIRRIDSLIGNATINPAETYEEQLCDEWMANKLQRLSEAKKQASSSERRAVAIDYTRISPVYRLYNESEIKLVFPNVRLAESHFSNLELTVYNGERILEKRSLSYFGNELGWTMKGFDLDLYDYMRKTGSGSGKIEPRIVISCDSAQIYDSGKAQFRDCLIFQGKNEIDIGSCKQGSYSVFVPADVNINFKNTEVSVIRDDQFLRGWYAVLGEGFIVNIGGNAAAFDGEPDAGSVRVVASGSVESAAYLENGIRYTVISGSATLHFIVSDTENIKKYRFMVNSELFELGNLPCKRSAGSTVYMLELHKLGTDKLSLRFFDLSENQPLFRGNYKLINDFSFKFNRDFYFSADDYRDARLSVSARLSNKEYQLMPFEPRVKVPFDEGELEIVVPTIKVIDNANVLWNGLNTYWIKDIPQDRFLYVKAPAALNYELYLDSRSIGTEGSGAFALGNSVFGYDDHNGNDRLTVTLSVLRYGRTIQSYVLGTIATKEQFIAEPVLRYENGSLSWDLGGGFIGAGTESIQLSVSGGDEYRQTFDLNLESRLITEGLDLPLGKYRYSIDKLSGNLFAMEFVNLACGTFCVGDENELRFLNSIIQINEITFEDDTKYDSVKIRPCFIDHIEFRGIRYVGSEDRECPVYNGIMFFISDSGKRHEYSYEDGLDAKGRKKYQMNPVKIVFINDSTLSITNETGDPDDPGEGFYYNSILDHSSWTVYYQLTDMEPNSYNKKWYYLADLYSYTKKED